MRKNESLEYVSADGMRSVIFGVGQKFSMTNVDGLSGLTSNIYSSQGSGQDGVTVVGTSVQPRVITVTGSIIRKTRAEGDELRRQLLATIRPKEQGRLIYRQGDIVRHIGCYIQTAPIVARAVYPPFQVILSCPDPYWREGAGSGSETISLSAWLPDLSFPLDLPEATGWILEHRTSETVKNLENHGDVAVGMTIVMAVSASTADPSITNVVTGEVLAFDGLSLVAGDILTVTTGFRKKRATLLRDGTTTNVTNNVTLSSTWLQLQPGSNFLQYSSDVINAVDVTIAYDPAYAGV